MPKQKFEIAYHLNTWDMAGYPLEPAFAFLRDTGFRSFEALTADSLMVDFTRRYMTIPVDLPPPGRDYELLKRLGRFSRAQTEFGLHLTGLYMTLSFTNSAIWPLELEMVRAVARYLKGCNSKFLVLGGGRRRATRRTRQPIMSPSPRRCRKPASRLRSWGFAPSIIRISTASSRRASSSTRQ